MYPSMHVLSLARLYPSVISFGAMSTVQPIMPGFRVKRIYNVSLLTFHDQYILQLFLFIQSHKIFFFCLYTCYTFEKFDISLITHSKYKMPGIRLISMYRSFALPSNFVSLHCMPILGTHSPCQLRTGDQCERQVIYQNSSHTRFYFGK